MLSAKSYTTSIRRFISSLWYLGVGIAYGEQEVIKQLFEDAHGDSGESFFAYPGKNGELIKRLVVTDPKDIDAFLKLADQLPEDERDVSREVYWRFERLTYPGMLMAHGAMPPRQAVNGQTRIAPYTLQGYADTLLTLPTAVGMEFTMAAPRGEMTRADLRQAVRKALLTGICRALYGVQGIPDQMLEYMDELEHLLLNSSTTNAQIEAFHDRFRSVEDAFYAEHAEAIIERSEFIRGQLDRDLTGKTFNDNVDQKSQRLERLKSYNLLLTLGLVSGNVLGVSESLLIEVTRRPEVLNNVQLELNALSDLEQAKDDDGKRQGLDVTKFETSLKEKCPYIWACLYETLRFRCMVPALSRKFKHAQTTKIGNRDVPAGTDVVGDIAALLRDPSHFKDASDFQPKRFLEGADNQELLNRRNIVRSQFGPKTVRGCPGFSYLAFALPFSILRAWSDMKPTLSENSTHTFPDLVPWMTIYKQYESRTNDILPVQLSVSAPQPTDAPSWELVVSNNFHALFDSKQNDRKRACDDANASQIANNQNDDQYPARERQQAP